MSAWTAEQVEAMAEQLNLVNLASTEHKASRMLRAYAATLRQQAALAQSAQGKTQAEVDRQAVKALGDGYSSVAAMNEPDAKQNTQGETPNKRATGVYHKFNVTRTDGSDRPGGKHEGGEVGL
jgi:hypothetical protein